MATSASTYGSSPFNPLGRMGQQGGMHGCRQQGGQSGPDSAGLAKAMSMVGINDSCSRPGMEPQAMSQDIPNSQYPLGLTQLSNSQGQPSSQAPASFLHTLPRRLAMELSQAHSQELCTPDFNTPQDQQQFIVDYEEGVEGGGAGVFEEEASRSPAPSPRRHIKRPRPILDLESDTVSQHSQSQSRSQGEPSTCSKAVSGLGGGGGRTKPPMHPNRTLRKKQEPPVIRNPYLQPAADNTHIYHQPPCNSSSRGHQLTFNQHRLVWDFKQEEKLGSGHFSEVYCVVHRMSGKRYALKRSRRPVVSIADKNMWLAEVQALAAVEGHPNIVTFYDSWVEPGDNNTGEHFFIRLELCGTNLGVERSSSGGKKREPMRETELVEVLRQMASALKHVHDLGLAHLDLKPDNIYRSRCQVNYQTPIGLNTAPSLQSTLTSQLSLSQSGNLASQQQTQQPRSPPCLYKLGDFGLACSKNEPAPVTEGDARYLAPELLTGRCEAGLDKADMFALGATLYELATGTVLPTGGDRYHALRSGQLMMMPCVSMKVQNLIKKLMSANPLDRPTADQVLRSSVFSGNHQGQSASQQ